MALVFRSATTLKTVCGQLAFGLWSVICDAVSHLNTAMYQVYKVELQALQHTDLSIAGSLLLLSGVHSRIAWKNV